MWILIRYLASRAGFYSPWWEYQHMAIRHNSQPQSGYLFSAQHYLTNNYSVYSIKPWNSHKWPQHPSVALKHYSTFYNGLMNKKAHTWQVLWCLGSEGTRWWQAEISLSPNYFIHRKTALLSVEQMRRVIWDERTWCFPDCRRKNSFYKVTCVEAESRNAARALWTASWELTTGAKQ